MFRWQTTTTTTTTIHDIASAPLSPHSPVASSRVITSEIVTMASLSSPFYTPLPVCRTGLRPALSLPSRRGRAPLRFVEI